MKDPQFVTLAPMFPWTDQKIRVHAAYCVLALLLAALLHREGQTAGFPGGLAALVKTLADLLPTAGRRTPGLPVTERTSIQEGLGAPFICRKITRPWPGSRENMRRR